MAAEPEPRGWPRIRRMEEADLDAVLDIERRSYPTPWSRAAFLTEILGREHAYSDVADMPGAAPGDPPRLCGYICYWVLGEEMQVNNIAVAHESRGRGVGEALMRHALETGRRHGSIHCYLDVRPSNAPAIHLYRKLGFSPIGIRRGYYQDTGEDSILMRAPLPVPERAK